MNPHTSHFRVVDLPSRTSPPIFSFFDPLAPEKEPPFVRLPRTFSILFSTKTDHPCFCAFPPTWPPSRSSSGFVSTPLLKTLRPLLLRSNTSIVTGIPRNSFLFLRAKIHFLSESYRFSPLLVPVVSSLGSFPNLPPHRPPFRPRFFFPIPNHIHMSPPPKAPF